MKLGSLAYVVPQSILGTFENGGKGLSLEMKESSSRGMRVCVYAAFKKSRMTSKEHMKITAFSPHT